MVLVEKTLTAPTKNSNVFTKLQEADLISISHVTLTVNACCVIYIYTYIYICISLSLPPSLFLSIYIYISLLEKETCLKATPHIHQRIFHVQCTRPLLIRITPWAASKPCQEHQLYVAQTDLIWYHPWSQSTRYLFEVNEIGPLLDFQITLVQ